MLHPQEHRGQRQRQRHNSQGETQARCPVIHGVINEPAR